jgi:hypothetical protein
MKRPALQVLAGSAAPSSRSPRRRPRALSAVQQPQHTRTSPAVTAVVEAREVMDERQERELVDCIRDMLDSRKHSGGR